MRIKQRSFTAALPGHTSFKHLARGSGTQSDQVASVGLSSTVSLSPHCQLPNVKPRSVLRREAERLIRVAQTVLHKRKRDPESD